MTGTQGSEGDLLGERRLIAETPIEQKEVTLPGAAGYPWSVCQFDCVERDSRQGREFLPGPGVRTWSVEYILSKNVALADEKVTLGQESMGSSHLGLDRDTEINVRDEESGETYKFTLFRGPDGTLGKIVVPVSTDHPIKARMIAARAVGGLLGVLSFQGNTPLYFDREILRDPESGWTRFWVVLPATAVRVGPLRLRLVSELRPVYALWRESRNARSYFYKFLCLFKIVEGLLESILPSIHKEMRRRGMTVVGFKELIPDDPHIKLPTPEFVGKKFTRVRDELKGEYRHALAHFSLDEAVPLDVDDPKTRGEYERLFAVVDYMAAVLIREAERLFVELEGGSAGKPTNA